MIYSQLEKKCISMGYNDQSWLKKCYDAAKAQPNKNIVVQENFFWSYLLREQQLPQNNYQNQMNQIDDQVAITLTEQLVKQVQKQTLEEHIKKSTVKYIRKQNFPVGLRNVGNTCSINSILQFLFQIPQISTWLFEMHQDQSPRAYFIRAWQALWKELETSQYHCGSPENLIQFLSWTPEEKLQFLNHIQKDTTEILLIMLTKLDSCLRHLHPSFLQTTNLHRLECFGMPHMNQFFQISSNNYAENNPMFTIPVVQGDLIKYLEVNYSNKINNLPEILIMQIERVQFSSNGMERLNQVFKIYKKLNLDFLMFKEQKGPQKRILLQKQESYNPLLQKQIEALQVVIDMYERDNDQIQTTKLGLKKQLLLQQQEEKYEPQINLGVNNYHLHTIFVHIGGANGGHIVVYIYNFALNEWFKFNDDIVTQMSGEDVMKESEKDVVLLTYVNDKQKEEIKTHCQKLLQVGNEGIKKLSGP